MSQTETGQPTSLLLVTTTTLGSEDVRQVADTWDGKRVALAPRGEPPADKRALLEAGWIVVDHLLDDARGTEALCAVMGRIAKPVGMPQGRFLYLSAGGADLAAVLDRLADPRAVIHDVDDRDDIILLGLGHELASHPLFWDFFDVAGSIGLDSESFLTLLRASLAGEEE